MEIQVIGTGSSGNCFLFGNSLMIDVGLPLKTIKEKVDLNQVSHILLTHIHGDHFNETTIRNIHTQYKDIIFVCGEWMHDKLRILFANNVERIEVIEMGKVYHFGDFSVAGVVAYHDVPNCGYRLVLNGHKHLHITDTCTLDGIVAYDYDTATIECNHEIETANMIINKAKEDGDYSHLLKAIENHLSVDKVIDFCKEMRVKRLIPVHIGNSTKKEVIKKLKEW